MYHPTYHQPLPVPPVAPLRPQGCNLLIRQQPKEALVTADGKERTRKPIDPPPIIELNVPPTYDPHQQYLQSPYLFTCVSLWKADKDEPYDGSGEKSLTGSLVSSLHRLKDVSNKDGGFFIFGDISVRVQGTFRLRFSLYEFQNGGVEVQCLGTCNSDKFKVLPAKDFKGMEESTYLSRAFSDQGVRLRLRKEPRGMMGGKRTYPYSSESSDAPLRPSMAGEQLGLMGSKRTYSDTQISAFDETSSPKRYKTDIDATVSMPTYAPSVSVSGYTYTPNMGLYATPSLPNNGAYANLYPNYGNDPRFPF